MSATSTSSPPPSFSPIPVNIAAHPRNRDPNRSTPVNPLAQAPLAAPPLPPKPHPHPPPDPQLALRIEDLSHPGTALFLKSVDALEVLRSAIRACWDVLYPIGGGPTNVEHILLTLLPLPNGVAYTTGTATHKTIALSLSHVCNSASRARDEIRGVITHEMVHCLQYDARGTAPGGLIEGIADLVRLRASLAPPHWSPTRVPAPDESWDAGYERTAYFLDWIERRYGAGTVSELNLAMNLGRAGEDGKDGGEERKWDEKIFKELTGRKVGKLWKIYKEELAKRLNEQALDNRD